MYEGRSNSNYSHCHSLDGIRSPTYRSWSAAKTRCTNPNQRQWADYGGRGITMCSRWMNSYKAFLLDMGCKPGPEYSLDRKNNDLPYDKENCRWATRDQQNRNSRRVRATPSIRARIRELAGILSQPKIALETGVSTSTVNRIIRGVSWTGE